MNAKSGWKTVLVALLAGAAALGCFAPVIYGAYKVYDYQTNQVLTINIKATPEDTYRNAIATIEERGVTKIVNRDDKDLQFTVEKRDGLHATVKISRLREEDSKMVIKVEKGKNPQVEREELVNTTLQICAKAGVQCEEDVGKR